MGSEATRVGEPLRQVQHLVDGGRPAMQQKQRERRRPPAGEVEEVHPQPVDLGAERLVGVETLLHPTPVEPATPVLHHLLQPPVRHTVAPIGER
jgi:hypothetical protein